MKRRLAIAGALLAAMSFLSACGGDDNDDAGDTATESATSGGDEGEGEPDAIVAVTAKEAEGKYSFEAPESVAAGIVTIELTNGGAEPHQAAFIKIDDGHTFDELGAALGASETGALPEWAHGAGGSVIASPGGGTSNLTQAMEAGSYALICVIPGPDGKPHAANGMVQPFTVEEAEGEAGELPEADTTIVAKDFEFEVPELEAGELTLGLENAGPSEHEIVIFGMQPGKKAADVVAFFSPGATPGPPPFTVLVGGLAPIETGGAGVTETNLAAGDYSLLCFVTAPDGQPHFALGMTADFTVA